MQGKQKPAKQTDIAKRRIAFLFRQARGSFAFDKNAANKHIKLARRIAMKYKVEFTAQQKKAFCKECLSYIVPGKNARVRLHKGRLIYYCFECKKYNRRPLE